MSLLDDIPGYDEPPPPRTADERIRDAIVALAEDLTDRRDYEIPVRTLNALCAGLDDLGRMHYFTDVLQWVVRRNASTIDRPTCDWNINLALDYLTGARW